MAASRVTRWLGGADNGPVAVALQAFILAGLGRQAGIIAA
jgi:hypothetical protein